MTSPTLPLLVLPEAPALISAVRGTGGSLRTGEDPFAATLAAIREAVTALRGYSHVQLCAQSRGTTSALGTLEAYGVTGLPPAGESPELVETVLRYELAVAGLDPATQLEFLSPAALAAQLATGTLRHPIVLGLCGSAGRSPRAPLPQTPEAEHCDVLLADALSGDLTALETLLAEPQPVARWSFEGAATLQVLAAVHAHTRVLTAKVVALHIPHGVTYPVALWQLAREQSLA